MVRSSSPARRGSANNVGHEVRVGYDSVVDSSGEQDRKNRRQSWPIEVRELADSGRSDLSASTTAEERLAMMWPLALEAWQLAGKPIPDYDRAEIPARVIHGYLGQDSQNSQNSQNTEDS